MLVVPLLCCSSFYFLGDEENLRRCVLSKSRFVTLIGKGSQRSKSIYVAYRFKLKKLKFEFVILCLQVCIFSHLVGVTLHIFGTCLETFKGENTRAKEEIFQVQNLY